MHQAKIAIIDYDMGNIMSVQNAFNRLGASTYLTNKESDIAKADAIVLPGVGAFGEAMKNLTELRLINILEEQVIKGGKPLLGICLGMQILFESSTEGGFNRGLSFLKGTVELLDLPKDLRLPHVGWNEIQVLKKEPLFARVQENSTFYFDHSFHVKCDQSIVSSISTYGIPIVASIKNKNIIATQFHPEKSHNSGLRLLRGFLNFVEGARHD